MILYTQQEQHYAPVIVNCQSCCQHLHMWHQMTAHNT